MKKGFTLAEALITLAIIGITTALTITIIKSDLREHQYNAGLKKAVKTINEGIALNITQGERSAFYTTANNTLYNYFQRSIKTSGAVINTPGKEGFYTLDGMYFEFPSQINKAIELPNGDKIEKGKIYNCGSKGFNIIDSDKTARETSPCVIMVDINGANKPNKLYADGNLDNSGNEPLKDIYYFIITDKMAIPYGEKPRKAAYQ